FQLLTTAICYGFLFWQMKLELINLKKQTANGLRTSRNKATPNSLDRCVPFFWTMRNIIKILILILPTIYCVGQKNDKGIPIERQVQLNQIIELMRQNNISGLADRVMYPIKRPNPIPDIKNKQEFIKYYKTLFDTEFKMKMTNTTFDSTNTINTYTGFGLFDGDIWLYDDGRIMTINHSSPEERKILESLKQQTEKKIHASVKPWKRNIYVCETDKFLIRVDLMQDNDLRYVSWSKPKHIKDKPDIILFNGVQEIQGTMGGVTFTFQNGEYFYKVDQVDMAETDEQVGLFLRIYKNKHDLEEYKDLASYKCKELK
ncbi:MAG: hypothetical protein O9294_19015, partial [Cytophagales bacterium]|nr:hypothetical protein [Cytophagales bacterium]